MTDILFIPDTQCKPNVANDHLRWVSGWIRDHRPAHIVHAGDHWDYPSLSSYDKGQRAAEGARVYLDYESGVKGLDLLESAYYGLRSYRPNKVFTGGNHELRLDRHENTYPWLAGALPRPEVYLAKRRWTHVPFQRVHRIAGVAFSHFFPRTLSGRITANSQKAGPSSALNMLKANMESCVAGHRQGLEVANFNLDTRRIRGIIAGSCYLHDEHYMPNNNYWRGILHLRRVNDGDFSLTEITLKELEETYG